MRLWLVLVDNPNDGYTEAHYDAIAVCTSELRAKEVQREYMERVAISRLSFIIEEVEADTFPMTT